MGVDYWGGGGQVPLPEFGVGDANANAPLRFCHMVQKGALCGFQNTPKSDFGRGTAPDPAGGAHDAPSEPLVGWGGDIPPMPHPTRHRPTFGARHTSPLRISAISTPSYMAWQYKFYV